VGENLGFWKASIVPIFQGKMGAFFILLPIFTFLSDYSGLTITPVAAT